MHDDDDDDDTNDWTMLAMQLKKKALQLPSVPIGLQTPANEAIVYCESSFIIDTSSSFPVSQQHMQSSWIFQQMNETIVAALA